MISNAYNLVDAGLLTPPIEFGFVMGAPNAQECSLRQLGHLTSMLRPGDTWTSVGVGKFEMPMAYAAIAYGGHVRVGLEDTNKLPDGRVATNYELVKHVVDMCKAVVSAQSSEIGFMKKWLTDHGYPAEPVTCPSMELADVLPQRSYDSLHLGLAGLALSSVFTVFVLLSKKGGQQNGAVAMA